MYELEPANPELSRARAVYWTLAPTAVGELIDTVEALTRPNQYGPDGILRGRTAQKTRSRIPLGLRRALDTKAAAVGLKALSAAGAAAVLTGRGRRWQQIAGAAMMFTSHIISDYRNPYGKDGSDQMSEQIAAYRIATALIPARGASDDLFLRAVNLQTALSYVASGSAKAISSSWLSGDALDRVLETRQYGTSFPARMIKANPPMGKLLTWVTIVWECSYPLVYLMSSQQARVALFAIKGFHAGIAATMGLPRFFWGFSSAHAAVAYVIDQRGARLEG